jgi:hypothetical protein
VRKFPSGALYSITILISIFLSIIYVFVDSFPAAFLFRTIAFYFYNTAIFTWCEFALATLREHKKIRVNPIKYSFYFILWPIIWGTEQFITKIAALFWPVKWKRIPHTIDKKVEEINDIPGLIE